MAEVLRKVALFNSSGAAVFRCLCAPRISLSVVVLAATLLIVHAADADPAFKTPAAITASAAETLTGDWFGQGPALRAAGLDFRLEWSQFYQGLAKGDASVEKRWAYGGKWDAQMRVDLSKLGFWNGLSVTAQGVTNYGESINAIALGGSLLAVNSALFFPGIKGADVSDLMALYVTQNFGNLVSLRVGKINMIELARYTPLKGGGGVDTFWNVEFAAPISGLVPPTLNGALLSINTQPVSFGLTVFDPQDATNKPLFSNLFENGVTVMGSATLRTTAIAGLTGYYGIKGIYSTREGRDFSELIPPPGTAPVTKKGSWFVSLSMQQFVVQDPNNPARGWGVFGEIAKADSNPNYHDWSVYFGVGGSSFFSRTAGRPIRHCLFQLRLQQRAQGRSRASIHPPRSVGRGGFLQCCGDAVVSALCQCAIHKARSGTFPGCNLRRAQFLCPLLARLGKRTPYPGGKHAQYPSTGLHLNCDGVPARAYNASPFPDIAQERSDQGATRERQQPVPSARPQIPEMG